MSDPKRAFDILILGGGIVGLSLAHMLQKTSLRVGLIEKTAPQAILSPEIGLRSSALNLSSEQLFRNLNLWQDLPHDRLSPFSQIAIFEASGFGALDFPAALLGETHLGTIVENHVLVHTLWHNLLKNQAVELIVGQSAQRLSEQGAAYEIQLDSGVTLQANLLIGADGAQSWLRKALPVAFLEHDHGESALICNVSHTMPHERVARQRFLPTGPLAFLPLGPQHSSAVVWTLPNQQATQMLNLPVAAFQQALASAFDYRLGPVALMSQRGSFPLHSLHVKQYVGPGWALVGDAAHVVHPLAGLGVNLGLRDAAALFDTIQVGLKQGHDLGSTRLLGDYERKRAGFNLATLGFLSFLNRFFQTDALGLVYLRSVGLSLGQRSPFLKKQIMRQAVGFSHDLPDIMR